MCTQCGLIGGHDFSCVYYTPLPPEPVTAPMARPRELCWGLGCTRELCAELDAYYGSSPLRAHYCRYCRRRHFRDD